MKTIVIADDHDIIREGIKSILSKNTEFKVIGEAADGETAFALVQRHQPDVLLLDLSMPKRSGLDIIEQLQLVSPATKIIVITMHRAGIYIQKALHLGVKGYLDKENVVHDLLPALRRVAKGENYVGPRVSQYLMEESGKKKRQGNPEQGILTEREGDILRLIAEGKTAKEVAEILFISPRTVENYKNILFKKLGLHKTTDLIKYAIAHNIVENDA